MKTILWNVDTQRDFIEPDGGLSVQGAGKIRGNLSRLTQLAKSKKMVVVNTGDWHNPDSEELSADPDFKTTFPEHCIKNSPGAEFIPETNPENPYKIHWDQDGFDEQRALQERNIVVYKDRFDAFAGSPHSEQLLRVLNPERAVVYGVATNVCVNDAVLGLLERNVDVYVPTDAIKELPNSPLPYETWQNHGAILTTTKEIEQMIGEGTL